LHLKTLSVYYFLYYKVTYYFKIYYDLKVLLLNLSDYK
jgi:hypothetical protein